MPKHYSRNTTRPGPYTRRATRSIMQAQVVKFINESVTGCVLVKVLMNFLKFSLLTDVVSFIQNNRSNFYCSRDEPSEDDQVWVKTELKLCEQHCSKDQKCTDRNCENLHVCRNFLLSGINGCPFNKGNKSCLFGHDLHSSHNRKLFENHNLGYLKDNEVQKLFRRRNCRSFFSMPQVCLYYNGRRGKCGCTHGNCKSLHFCLDYIQNKCDTSVCDKIHSMKHPYNRKILDLFAIDYKETWSKAALLEDLNKLMNTTEIRLNTKTIRSSGSMRDIIEDDRRIFESDRGVFDDSFTVDKHGTRDNLPGTSINKDGHCCKKCERNEEICEHLLTKVNRLESEVEQIKNYRLLK